MVNGIRFIEYGVRVGRLHDAFSSYFVEDCRIEVTLGVCDELPIKTVFIQHSSFANVFEAKPSFETVVMYT